MVDDLQDPTIHGNLATTVGKQGKTATRTVLGSVGVIGGASWAACLLGTWVPAEWEAHTLVRILNV